MIRMLRSKLCPDICRIFVKDLFYGANNKNKITYTFYINVFNLQFDFSFLVNVLYTLFSKGKNLHSSNGISNQNTKQRNLVEIDLNANQNFLENEHVERRSQNSEKICSFLLFAPNENLNLSPYSSPFEVLKAAIRKANSCNNFKNSI